MLRLYNRSKSFLRTQLNTQKEDISCSLGWFKEQDVLLKKWATEVREADAKNPTLLNKIEAHREWMRAALSNLEKSS